MSGEKPMGNGEAVKRLLAMGPPDSEWRADIESVRDSVLCFDAEAAEDEASS